MSRAPQKLGSDLCRSLTAVGSATYRADPRDNQDAAETLRLPQTNLVALADGMGSFSHAGEAARFCAHTLLEQIARGIANGEGHQPPDALFASLNGQLRQYAASERTDAGAVPADFEKTYGTTLLLGAETSEELDLFYLGNGAAFRIPGNFWQFPCEIALPWCWVNLLNPHSQSENGREALYRYLSPAATPPMLTPTVLRLSKDAHFGDLLILATDGICSNDQTVIGDANGTLWMQLEATLIALHRCLRALFCALEAPTQSGLQAALDAYLLDIKAQGLLDDDATLGVIVTAEALDYHARAHRSQEEAI